MGRPLGARVKVVGPAFASGAILSWLFAVKVPDHGPELCASALAGPFAGLWATATWGPADALGWAAASGLAIAAHPLRAGRVAGFATAAGVGLWVLLGLMLTYDGV